MARLTWGYVIRWFENEAPSKIHQRMTWGHVIRATGDAAHSSRAAANAKNDVGGTAAAA
jgi:hypothetical protein